MQIDGPKNRTCTRQAASFLRKHCARPYGFKRCPTFNTCRRGVSPPDKFMQKREAKRLPYRQNIKIRTHFVGDDILGVPFIKISLRFARTTGGRPYRRYVVLSFLIVGTVRPYLLCKLTVLKIGRALGKPQVCFANIVNRPTASILQ